MALPPSPAAAPPMPPAGGPAGTPPPDMAAAPDDDMGEDANEPEIVATILKNPDGSFTLMKGDEPEEEGGEMEPGAADQGQSFDTPQALMRGIMAMLNDTDGAEKAFTAAGKGGNMGGLPAKPPM